ncbi:hypothetical protein BDA96_03G420400 [Sorghum bicolor]|uniref:Uncharacterized protein n=2 Tax=Sorghum bicolor TaxID=4558 RepID=A0A921URG4_SORBI|nr:hypothetical protein BDA96_03G420400 [Sorghum bicolor]OQU88042.1 hypothetical protein SORBI_3003G389601 [Sorghum bicolor]
MTPAALYSPSRWREDPVHLRRGSGFVACGVLVVYCARKRKEDTTAPHLVRARAPPRQPSGGGGRDPLSQEQFDGGGSLAWLRSRGRGSSLRQMIRQASPMVAQSEVRCRELLSLNRPTLRWLVLTTCLHGLAPRWLLLQHLVLISAATFTAAVKHSFHLLPHLLL